MNINKNYYEILSVNPESYETVIILTTESLCFKLHAAYDLIKYNKI